VNPLEHTRSGSVYRNWLSLAFSQMPRSSYPFDDDRILPSRLRKWYCFMRCLEDVLACWSSVCHTLRIACQRDECLSDGYHSFLYSTLHMFLMLFIWFLWWLQSVKKAWSKHYWLVCGGSYCKMSRYCWRDIYLWTGCRFLLNHSPWIWRIKNCFSSVNCSSGRTMNMGLC